MRFASPCIESLEGRMLLSAAIEIRADLKAMYMPGANSPYGYNGEFKINNNAEITGATVHTPAGRWMSLSAKSGNGEGLSWDKFFDTKAEMDSELGDGVYTIYLQTTSGPTTHSFNSTGLLFPTQIPSTTSLTHGRTDTPTNLSIALPTITDSSINNISLYISNSNNDQVYDSYFNPGSGSLAPVALASGNSYWAELKFRADKWEQTADYNFSFEKTNQADFIFATTGFTQGRPDLNGSFSAAPATLNPGDSFVLNVAVGSSGGIVIGSGSAPQQPLLHKMGMSINKIIGDADDVTLYRASAAGETAGWGFANDLNVTIPDTAMPGSYFVYGYMDSTQVANESNENNNIGWSSSAVITIPPQAITLDPVTHRLSILGTGVGDTVNVALDGLTVHATLNGTTRSFARAEIASLYINGYEGNDAITVGDGLSGVTIYGGTGNDTITSGSGDDVIYGGDGDDRIFSQAGNDSVYGGRGADSITGGAGNDSLIGGDGSDTILGGFGDDYIEGKGKADTIYGGDGSDTILGGAGDDYIEGKGKADTIYGGVGNDTILGGAGNNMIYGDDGDDRIFAFNSTSFRDTIDGGAGDDTVDRDSNDILTNVEHDLLHVA